MTDCTSPRPRRQSPQATRRRLVAAAADCFNADGLFAVDARRIARTAGYSNGAFYKHFRDKREALIAAYDESIAIEWEVVASVLISGGDEAEIAERVVDVGIGLHKRWRGLRSAMVALVAIDDTAKRAYRAIQKRQLETMKQMRQERGLESNNTSEADAIFLLTLERGYDALADGEVEELGMSRSVFRDHLCSALLNMVRSGRSGSDH